MLRTMRGLCLAILCLAFLLGSANLTQTLAATPPLLVGIGNNGLGDTFAYTSGGLKNLTNYGRNGPPILSPDGKFIAYSSIASNFKFDRSGSPSSNIWLMNVATGDAKRLADQPPDNRVQGDTRVRPFSARSNPSWSLDGKSLSWMENSEGTKDSQDDGNDHLIIFNTANGKGKEIYKQPEFMMGCPCTDAIWTTNGISVLSADYPNTGFVFRVLDLLGKVKSETKFDQLPSVQWLTGESTPTIVTNDELITLSDNVRSTTLPPLEIYSTSAPNGLRFHSNAGYFGADWTLSTPEGTAHHIGKIVDFAISPDGKQASYTTDDGNTLYFFDGNKINKIDIQGTKLKLSDPAQVTGLAWSQLAIRIESGQ